jgi:hypothetical protein
MTFSNGLFFLDSWDLAVERSGDSYHYTPENSTVNYDGIVGNWKRTFAFRSSDNSHFISVYFDSDPFLGGCAETTCHPSGILLTDNNATPFVTTSVPEPNSHLLMLAGLLMLGGVARKGRNLWRLGSTKEVLQK